MVDGEVDLEREAAKIRGRRAEQALERSVEGAEAAIEQGLVGPAFLGGAERGRGGDRTARGRGPIAEWIPAFAGMTKKRRRAPKRRGRRGTQRLAGRGARLYAHESSLASFEAVGVLLILIINK